MHTTCCDRRAFLKQTALASVAVSAGLATPAQGAGNSKLHLSSNSYSWGVFFQRDGKNFGASLDDGLKAVAQSGLNGYEPGIGSPADIATHAPWLKKHGLEMRSIYMGSTLHTEAEAEQSIQSILEVAKAAKAVGTQLVVTNPNPIKWGGPEVKDDAQLRTQAAAMNRLGKALAGLGLKLAFHNHDIELRNAAREFHHMMVGTDPQYVGLCLDSHWVYRGSGNSSVALFDVVKLYGSRVWELHLRQSEKGIWSETLGPGDIDYEALVAALVAAKAKPHLVMEIAVEQGTPKTMDSVEAHRRSVEYARRVFAPLA